MLCGDGRAITSITHGLTEKDYKSILAGKAPRHVGEGQFAGLLMDESIIDLHGNLVDGDASSGSSDGDAERFDLVGGLGELIDGGDFDGDDVTPSDSDEIPEEEPGPLLPPLAPAGDLPPVTPPGDPPPLPPPLPPPDDGDLPPAAPADDLAVLPPVDDMDAALPAEAVLRRGHFGCFTITPRQPADKPPFGGYQARCPWHAFTRPEILYRYV